MPLQGKKRPEAATYDGIQNQKGQKPKAKGSDSIDQCRITSTQAIESDPFGYGRME